MSTRISIKYSREDDKPGYHLWEDCFEVMADPSGADVVLELFGIEAELSTSGNVMVVLPRAMARELGLLPSGDTPAPQSTEGGDGRFIGGAAGEATYGAPEAVAPSKPAVVAWMRPGNVEPISDRLKQANPSFYEHHTIPLVLAAGVPVVDEQQRLGRESAAFDAWWVSSGHAADPAFNLTIENCARAAWHARAAAGVALSEAARLADLAGLPRSSVQNVPMPHPETRPFEMDAPSGVPPSDGGEQ